MSGTDVHKEDSLKPEQGRALIHLAFLGGTVSKASDLKPGLNAKLRKELIEKKMLAAGPKIMRRLPLALQDAGWRWVMQNLTTELPAREQLAGMLMKILSRVAEFLKENGLDVQDVILARRIHPGAEKAAAADASADEALLRVALELGGGHIAERIRLRDLRPRMEDIGYTRNVLDKTISDLQLEGTLSVIPIDLPADLDDRDRAAALDIAGVQRHAIILRRRARN